MVLQGQESMVKVYFTLDRSEWHGFSSESLWASYPNSLSGVRLMNAPFFAKGISNGDAVSVRLIDEEIWFFEVIKKSGHATLRLLVRDFKRKGKKAIQKLKLLEQSDCKVEGASLGEAKLFSVDVPVNVAALDVVRLVDSGVELDYWDAEMGDVAGRKGFWHY